MLGRETGGLFRTRPVPGKWEGPEMSNSVVRAEDLRPVITRILILSAGAILFLVWILFFKVRTDVDPDALGFLPAVNALLNGLATTCIVSGFIAIKLGRRRVHMTFMITAVALSVIFLVSYITYHNIHGNTEFLTQGFIRYLYFFVLFSHIGCTVFALPLIMTAVFFAATRRFELHKKVVKYTLPVWLYVSVTGVIIYFLLEANS